MGHARLVRQTHDIETLPGTTNNTNFANAINAVAGPNGAVCASAAAQAAGCVPINVFGLGAVQLPGALAYITGDPTRQRPFELDEGAADITHHQRHQGLGRSDSPWRWAPRGGARRFRGMSIHL